MTPIAFAARLLELALELVTPDEARDIIDRWAAARAKADAAERAKFGGDPCQG
jgi:hypothetical protein